MTLYVGHVGPIIIGSAKKSNNVDPFLRKIREVKIESLGSFLAHLKPEERTFFAHAAVTYSGIAWADKVFGRGAKIYNEIGKIVVPMIQEGRIPDDLDFVELQRRLGIADRESLEVCIFQLLKGIGEDSINWTSGFINIRTK